jgi:hypothetical protein
MTGEGTVGAPTCFVNLNIWPHLRLLVFYGLVFLRWLRLLDQTFVGDLYMYVSSFVWCGTFSQRAYINK